MVDKIIYFQNFMIRSIMEFDLNSYFTLHVFALFHLPIFFHMHVISLIPFSFFFFLPIANFHMLITLLSFFKVPVYSVMPKCFLFIIFHTRYYTFPKKLIAYTSLKLPFPMFFSFIL